MATTTNFSWSTPDDTGLVKDGASNIRTLGSAVDARFGDVTNYPNQLVNVVSGVSRPVAYAVQAGTASATYPSATTVSASITFAASRFTQAPLITATVASTTPAALLSVVKSTSITTSGFTIRWDNPASQTGTTSAHWVAVQMTSASASG